MKSKCINCVELRGAVGTVRINETGEGRIARFSLATNYVYRASDGMPVIETTWQDVSDVTGLSTSIMLKELETRLW